MHVLRSRSVFLQRLQSDAVVVLQINYWVKDEQNETMALFRIIRNQTDHGMIIALREDTDYWVNVQVLNSGLNLGPKSEFYPVRTLRAGRLWCIISCASVLVLQHCCHTLLLNTLAAVLQHVTLE